MSPELQIAEVTLGATDIRVSPLGIGAWSWGDRMFWGYGGDYGLEDVRGAFETSFAAGINFFDTAEMYGWGQSEKLLGRFVRSAEQPLVIASKFMPYPWRLRSGDLRRALRKSLDRLGRPQLDLYQIHHPLHLRSLETWMDAMADAVEAGLIHAVGVSNYDTDQMRRAHAALAKRGLPLASNQVAYSLLERAPERTGLMDACRDLNVALIAYSPLAQGLLTGKYTPDNRPDGVRRFRYSAELLRRIQPLVALLEQLGAAHGGKTAAQVAVNWVICKGAIPIPGAKTAAHAAENAGALGWRLTDGQVAALDDASAKLSGGNDAQP
jgi:aryl-alcohol dehydrogenase-like predicted oxidoreductase